MINKSINKSINQLRTASRIAFMSACQEMPLNYFTQFFASSLSLKNNILFTISTSKSYYSYFQKL